MRAKVKITEINKNPEEGDTISERLTFEFPSKDGAYPADGSDEDQQFARYTPHGLLAMTVNNPALFGKFAVGDTFYLDFTKIEGAGKAAPKR